MVNTEKRKIPLRQKTWNHTWVLSISIVIGSALISLAMILCLAAPKNVYQSEINKISNTLGHMNDAALTLNKFSTYQSNQVETLTDNLQTLSKTTQSKFDQEDSKIDDVSSNLSAFSDSTQKEFSRVDGEFSVVNNQLSNHGIRIVSLQNDLATANTQLATLQTQQTQLSAQISSASQNILDLQSQINALNNEINDLYVSSNH